MILKLYYVRNMIHNNNTYIFYQISISSNLQPNGTRRLLQANHKQSNIRNERSEQQFTAGRGIWTNQCWYGKSTSNEEASHMACLGSAQWQVISCRNEMRLYRGECCSLQKIKKPFMCTKILANRNRTGDRWISAQSFYSPPLYQLSYREYTHIAAVVTLHNIADHDHSMSIVHYVFPYWDSNSGILRERQVC